MKIVSTAFKTPKHIVDSNDTLAYIDKHHVFASSTEKFLYKKMVKKLLDYSGAKTRYLRLDNTDETPFELITQAISNALEKANMVPQDIDILIYCGVGRGFLEPANAYFFARHFGLKNANCFDITDACMSWVRALHFAYYLLKEEKYRNVMVINGEFHLHSRSTVKECSLKTLEYSFPMYTVGEAATATILQKSDSKWSFKFKSNTNLANLCTIPLSDYKLYAPKDDKIGLNGINAFSSFAQELFAETATLMRELLTEHIDVLQRKDLLLSHAATKRGVEDFFDSINLDKRRVFLDVYPNFGNIVSASIPVAIALAEDRGLIKRGDNIAFIPTGAGGVGNLTEFTF